MKAPIQLALEAGIPVTVKNGVPTVKVRPATARYLMGPHTAIPVGPFCSCRSFRLPHSPTRHDELRSDYDWRAAEERGDVGIELQPRPRRSSASDIPEEILQEWYA